MDPEQTLKRPYASEDEPTASKRVRAAQTPATEAPQQYSDAVRRKLASTTRTGQACDRCKERKMKCDANPIACGPCRQKNLPCWTTDRVTGRAAERGQPERLEGELQSLRRELAAYQRKYGLLREDDFFEQHGYNDITAIPLQLRQQHTSLNYSNPLSITELHSGPVNGAIVDTFFELVDIANFDCPDMEEYDQDEVPKFNNSKTSLINTICGAQRIEDPRLPSKEQALIFINHFLGYIWPYVPVVNKSNFFALATRYYDEPEARLSRAEVVTIVLVLAITSHQIVVRNKEHTREKMEDSNRWLHYALGYYRDLVNDQSLASVTALTLLIIYTRNLPKPGFSWLLCHKVLVRAIELNYHRDPDRISLPEAQNNPMDKEVRKRVFWTILGICVTTGTKVGKPTLWHFQHLDCPLPLALEDSEISTSGISLNRSGKCDFWVALHLFKLLPLLTDLYNNVISIRQRGDDYIRHMESLNSRIVGWRQDWDRNIELSKQDGDGNLEVAQRHIDTWAAEFQLILHHPSLCTADSPEIYEHNIETCYKSAQRLMTNFRTLVSKFKGADFTWHSTAAYALGFGATLFIHSRRKELITQEKYEGITKELVNWLTCMKMADAALRTNNHLYRTFEPRAKRLDEELVSILNHQRQQHHLLNGSTAHTPHDVQQPSPTISYTPIIKYEPPGSNSGLASPYPPLAATNSQGSYIYPLPTDLHQIQPQSQPHVESQSSYPTYTIQQGQYPTQISTSLAPLSNAEASATNQIDYMQYATASTGQHADALVALSRGGPWNENEVAAAVLWPDSIHDYQMPQGTQGGQNPLSGVDSG